MLDPIFLAALGATVLFGCILFRTLRAERRKANVEPRLIAISAAAAGEDAPAISLRRAPPPRRALPLVCSSHLDSALSATGGRVGLLHLTLTGTVSAAAIGLAAVAAGSHRMPRSRHARLGISSLEP